MTVKLLIRLEISHNFSWSSSSKLLRALLLHQWNEAILIRQHWCVLWTLICKRCILYVCLCIKGRRWDFAASSNDVFGYSSALNELEMLLDSYYAHYAIQLKVEQFSISLCEENDSPRKDRTNMCSSPNSSSCKCDARHPGRLFHFENYFRWTILI